MSLECELFESCCSWSLLFFGIFLTPVCQLLLCLFWLIGSKSKCWIFDIFHDSQKERFMFGCLNKCFFITEVVWCVGVCASACVCESVSVSVCVCVCAHVHVCVSMWLIKLCSVPKGYNFSSSIQAPGVVRIAVGELTVVALLVSVHYRAISFISVSLTFLAPMEQLAAVAVLLLLTVRC